MKKLFAVLSVFMAGCMSLQPKPLHQGKNYILLSRESIVSVYDGDTFTAQLPTDCNEWWTKNLLNPMSIRVLGYDAPEIRGKCEFEKKLAKKAREQLKKILSNAEEIRLQNLSKGKYFRLVASVYVDGQDITAAMLESGLVREYNGGTRSSWCEGNFYQR